MLLAQGPQALLDSAPSRGADDISYEEDPQLIASVAAAWTSTLTWLPASCV